MSFENQKRFQMLQEIQPAGQTPEGFSNLIHQLMTESASHKLFDTFSEITWEHKDSYTNQDRLLLAQKTANTIVQLIFQEKENVKNKLDSIVNFNRFFDEYDLNFEWVKIGLAIAVFTDLLHDTETSNDSLIIHNVRYSIFSLLDKAEAPSAEDKLYIHQLFALNMLRDIEANLDES